LERNKDLLKDANDPLGAAKDLLRREDGAKVCPYCCQEKS
jgi:hypothetical protein